MRKKLVINTHNPCLEPILDSLSIYVYNNGCEHNFKNLHLVFDSLKGVIRINRKETIKVFKNHGGYCDCEVLFNVTPKSLLVDLACPHIHKDDNDDDLPF